jgi:hypothetical protein
MAFCIVAGGCWYGLGSVPKLPPGNRYMQRETETPTPLPTKIDQLLTEARVILPGAQALLGFRANC